VLSILGHRFTGQPNDTAVGPWLAARRRTLRLSQNGLGAAVGLSKPTVIQIERGQGHLRSLCSIIAALGLPLTLRPDEVTSTHLNGASALVKVHVGDALGVLRSLANNSFNSCITSPPYFQQRDYGVTGQIGLEPTPDDYIRRLVECFREVRRVLRRDGTFWLGSGTASVRPQEAAKTYSAFRGGLPLHCRPMAGSFGRTS
jgi:DNA-binding XRE family transcriptional regulator